MAATRPHDIADLHLAPLVLAIDARIEQLGQLDEEAFASRVGLDSDRSDWSRALREYGLISTVTHLIDCHGWTVTWDTRGLRLTHGEHTLVLGIPPVFGDYLDQA